MKTKLEKALNSNVNPLFLALPCALLIAAMGQATLFAKQIDNAHDAILAIIYRPFPNELWLNPHRKIVPNQISSPDVTSYERYADQCGSNGPKALAGRPDKKGGPDAFCPALRVAGGDALHRRLVFRPHLRRR
jgi:hypothetical protein